MANGFLGGPGIFTLEQVDGWRKITKTLKREDCKAVLQVYHTGRKASKININGQLPWGPSAIAIRGNDKFGDNKPYPVPH